MSNIQFISDIPGILHAEEITYERIEGAFSADWKQKAKENCESVFAYKIKYRSQGHAVIGYVVEPREGENLPCIIFNRGGSSEYGQLKDEDMVSPPISNLVKNGYIVITTQYSGNDGGEGKDEHGGGDVEDVLALYAILKNYSRADVRNVGMYGASRGGMMAYIVLSKASWLKAAVVHAGTADLFNMETFRPEMKGVFERMFGGSSSEKEKRSVLYWAEKLARNTPILIMHGTGDAQVDPQDSIRLAEKLGKLKIPHKLVLYEDDDHRLSRYRKEGMQEAIGWFDRYLKS